MSHTNMYPEASAMSRQGKMAVPSTAVVIPPARNESLLGARLTNAFAGATMFAAMLVESVATRRPPMATAVVSGPPSAFASSATGSATAVPNITAEHDVIATDMNENAAMKNGSPIV